MKKILLSLILFMCFALNLQAQESKGKVLVVMSNADKLELKDKQSAEVGFFLNEFAIPVKALMDAGYEVVVATPKGKVPVMDKDSNSPKFFEDNKAKYEEAVALSKKVLAKKNIHKLSDVSDGSLKEYKGIFIPGGHAPLIDLMTDASLGKILEYFHKNNLPTAMLCHGPIVAISTMENPVAFRKELVAGDQHEAELYAKDWLYNDYEMTIFSTKEEKEAEKSKLNGKVEFYPEDALKTAGAKIKNGDPMQVNVVEDRELITGQNPASDAELAHALINAMDKKN